MAWMLQEGQEGVLDPMDPRVNGVHCLQLIDHALHHRTQFFWFFLR